MSCSLSSFAFISHPASLSFVFELTRIVPVNIQTTWWDPLLSRELTGPGSLATAPVTPVVLPSCASLLFWDDDALQRLHHKYTTRTARRAKRLRYHQQRLSTGEKCQTAIYGNMTLVLSLSQSNHRRLSQREFTALPNAVGSEPGQSDQKNKTKPFQPTKTKGETIESFLSIPKLCHFNDGILSHSKRKRLARPSKRSDNVPAQVQFPSGIFSLFLFFIPGGRQLFVCLFSRRVSYITLTTQ